MKNRTHTLRLSVLAALALGLSACGGGGGGESSAPPSEAPTPPPSDPPPPQDIVTISGSVSFDLVPSVAGLGLDYTAIEVSPVRGATVELVSGNTVLTATVTDANGGYSVTADASLDVFIRVKAELVQSGAPGWNMRVVDNTSSDALYALDGSVFNTGTADSTVNLHAESGWGGTSYVTPRAAAPFAILDVMYEAVQLVQTGEPTIVLPALELHWSPDNVPSLDASGSPNADTGEIGGTFFSSFLGGIFLLGAENVDTEEYDRHVILHEWGHYFEREFSRSDSVGGPHTRHDQLDMRVAFGEGLGNALSAMISGQSVYRDAVGQRQGSGFAFDIEGALPQNPNQNPGWYSEESIQQILYDLFDGVQDTVEDTLALGFAPLFSVLNNQQRDTTALTSIFPFITALKADLPAQQAQIDTLVSAHNIDTINDIYGSAETHSGNPANGDVLPIYSDLTINGPTVNVCSTDDFNSVATGSANKLGSRRFLKFTVANAGTHTMTAVTTGVPAGASSDPDMSLHRRGLIAISDGAPSFDCAAQTPENCVESFSRTLIAGDYVLEVYEWTNTESADDEFPPIGRTCFDMSITRP